MDYEKNLGKHIAFCAGIMFTAIACLYMLAVRMLLDCKSMTVIETVSVGGVAIYFVMLVLMMACAIRGGISFLGKPGEFNRIMTAMRPSRTERFI